jgi:predicted small secreted protein
MITLHVLGCIWGLTWPSQTILHQFEGNWLINRTEFDMKIVIAMIVAGAFGLSLAGCNTISGAGKDVARGGEKIQEASAKVRSEWREWRAGHDRDYDEARTKCASGSDAERDACRDRVRAESRARMDEARAKYHRAEMRAQSEEDRREDAYEAARDACYPLKGAAEDNCLADVRAKYRR